MRRFSYAVGVVLTALARGEQASVVLEQPTCPADGNDEGSSLPDKKGVLLMQLSPAKGMASVLAKQKEERSTLLHLASDVKRSCSGPPGAVRPQVKVVGWQLLVNGKPFHLKGINWNPVPVGQTTPFGINFPGSVEQDSTLMQNAKINAVRTYEPILDCGVLDTFYKKGIYVLNTIFPYGGGSVQDALNRVNQVKDHPAILFWVVGNEWNYNFIYYNQLGFGGARQKVSDVAAAVKAADPTRPLASILGFPSIPPPQNVIDLIFQIPSVDVWGVNYYNGLSFQGLFDWWRKTLGSSPKPFFLGEYGADAWNTNANREDQDSQAQATQALTNEIIQHSAVNGGVCIGGMLFELADEWWKDSRGSVWNHDTGGAAPGLGPYPDNVFNEEWWGIVDANRNPRSAYSTYASLAIPLPPDTVVNK